MGFWESMKPVTGVAQELGSLLPRFQGSCALSATATPRRRAVWYTDGHMDPHSQPGFPYGDDATAPPTPVAEPDTVVTEPEAAPTVSSPAPVASRHLYTMTVDQALAELYAHELYRDVRTVQRWCKAGKLRAIVDEQNGDRYLIDPASLRDMVATLLEERTATAQRVAPTPRPETRPRPDTAGASSPGRDTAAATASQSHATQADKSSDAATQAAAQSATSQGSRDEVAALERRVAELEREKVMLEVDKRVREELVEYLKAQFGGMLDEALTRTEELGALRAENRQLRAMLPAAGQGAPTGARQPDAPGHSTPRFSPSSIDVEEQPPLHRHAPWSSDDHV